MQASEERDKLLQLQHLNAFLATLTALDSVPKRFDKYQEVYRRLHEQQRIGGPPELRSSIYPISDGQRPFFEAFSVCIQQDLREVAVSRSGRMHCPPNSKWYNTELINRIDRYLSHLAIWTRVTERADAARARAQMEPPHGDSDSEETEAEAEESSLRTTIINIEHNMANDFLKVILFLFAVPQETPLKVRVKRTWPYELIPPLEPSELDMNVAWMNEDCKWYQQNQTFMAFLADSSVIALIIGYYEFSASFTEICQSYRDIVHDYTQADVFVEHITPQQVLHDDAAGEIAGIVRERAHDQRRTRHSQDPASNAPASTATTRALLELRALFQ
jgi:hypothetical protein